LLRCYGERGKAHGAMKSEFLRPLLFYLFAQVLPTDEAVQYTVSHNSPKEKYPKRPSSFVGAVLVCFTGYKNAGFGIPTDVRTELLAEETAFARSIAHLTCVRTTVLVSLSYQSS
uniref:Tick transposon n=1 Tax=Gongylonema pulchrum TaxID=637853 RepID=A0A183DZS9_9BILA